MSALRERLRSGLCVMAFGVIIVVGPGSAATATEELSVAEQSLGGKTQHLTCDSSECSFHKSIGGGHSEDFNVMCQVGSVDFSSSSCRSESHWMECDMVLEDAEEFKCHCKNKATGSEHLKIHIGCASN